VIDVFFSPEASVAKCRGELYSRFDPALDNAKYILVSTTYNIIIYICAGRVCVCIWVRDRLIRLMGGCDFLKIKFVSRHLSGP